MFTSRSYIFILALGAAALVYAAVIIRFSDNDETYAYDTSQSTGAVFDGPSEEFYSDGKFTDNVFKNSAISLKAIERSILNSLYHTESNKEKAPEEIRSYQKPQEVRPTARAYLVGNLRTGKVFIAEKTSQSLPVASMSKLVTALTLEQLATSSTLIEVNEEAIGNIPDSVVYYPGETFSIEEILRTMLIPSSNIAATAIAKKLGGTSFLEEMSQYAWNIGMNGAFFADPSGLDAHNMASAENIFTLAKHLYNIHPEILAITRMAAYSLASTTTHGEHAIVSTHPFVTDTRFIGGKTGRTLEAGETMLTILNINNQPIAFIVLASQVGNREGDTRILINKYLNSQRLAQTN